MWMYDFDMSESSILDGAGTLPSRTHERFLQAQHVAAVC